MGVRKTYDRIMHNFYWPGICGDVKRFCRSCDICQRTVDKGTVSRALVQNMPDRCFVFILYRSSQTTAARKKHTRAR